MKVNDRSTNHVLKETVSGFLVRMIKSLAFTIGPGNPVIIEVNWMKRNGHSCRCKRIPICKYVHR